MKKKILIIYENINREYDNCLLLKAELERRGYTVVLKYKTESICIVQDADLVITPNCYNIENERYYRYLFAGNKCPLLSLQYEQIFTKESEIKRLCYPDNDMPNVYFAAWGEIYYNKLLQHGIKPSATRVTGSVGLDFCRPEFRCFYLDKGEMGRKYNLDVNKKWMLFISSMTLFPESPYYRHLSIDIKDKGYLTERSNFEVKTQEKILEWFDEFLISNNDYIIIYRRHPVEEQSEKFKLILSKYPKNFLDIADMSVKQWIAVCDYCYNWFSTASIEANEFGKPTQLLRPYPISEERDYSFLSNSIKCSTYEEFASSTKQKNADSIDRSLYIDNYSVTETPAYYRICDFLDGIIERNEQSCYYFDKYFILNRFKYYIKKFFIFKLAIKRIYQFANKKLNFVIKSSKIRSKYCITQLEYSVKFHNDSINIIKYDKIRDIVHKLSI